jgi:hypothetical protein
LSADGKPLYLDGSGGHVVVRQILGTSHKDLVGPYPLFLCRDWASLKCDLVALREQYVSIVLVTDPFGEIPGGMLSEIFSDVCRPYKQHCIVDFGNSWLDHISAHHKRNIRKAARMVTVRHVDKPASILSQWLELYSCLKRRHNVRGPSDFSDETLAAQLRIPGLVAFVAEVGKRTVGVTLWMADGEYAYYHLAAYSDEGYSVGASFALFERALVHFYEQGVNAATLGSSSGVTPGQEDGLSRFKRGWSNSWRPVFLCGEILDSSTYLSLARRVPVRRGEGLFPAYRF